MDFICGIFGTTTPFTTERLLSLYPTHDVYVDAVKKSAEATVKAGFLLEPEAKGFIEDAQKPPVPK